MTSLISLLNNAVIFGTVILYGAIGEIITEKSGNLNLGVPGIMYLGGIAGLATAFYYEMLAANPIGIVSLLLSFIAAFLAAALGGLIYSFLTITL
ncbi:MAG: ABC transporter permease, partial [Oscillospiraceae bacterium]|nr:ABC transporter permease [Oscillospiraceae bacterium]